MCVAKWSMTFDRCVYHIVTNMNVQNDVQKVIVLSDNETIILSDIDNLGVKPSSKLSLTSLRLEVGFFRVMNYCFAVRQVIHRSKIRVLKMLIVVVILFAFCWLPLYVVNIRLFFGPPIEIPSREFDLLTQIVIPLAQWLGLSSCSVNPVVYCLFSGKFRAGYRSLIVSASCCSCCVRVCIKESLSASPVTTSGRFFVNGNRSVFASRASEVRSRLCVRVQESGVSRPIRINVAFHAVCFNRWTRRRRSRHRWKGRLRRKRGVAVRQKRSACRLLLAT
jgi:hypothetical protein